MRKRRGGKLLRKSYRQTPAPKWQKPSHGAYKSSKMKVPAGSIDGDVQAILEAYMSDMYLWGKKVRDDIAMIKKQLALVQQGVPAKIKLPTPPEGDPGDPPAGPWGPRV